MLLNVTSASLNWSLARAWQLDTTGPFVVLLLD